MGLFNNDISALDIFKLGERDMFLSMEKKLGLVSKYGFKPINKGSDYEFIKEHTEGLEKLLFTKQYKQVMCPDFIKSVLQIQNMTSSNFVIYETSNDKRFENILSELKNKLTGYELVYHESAAKIKVSYYRYSRGSMRADASIVEVVDKIEGYKIKTGTNIPMLNHN